MKTNYSIKNNCDKTPGPDKLLSLYQKTTGFPATCYKAITGSASSRRYYHIEGTSKLVGVIGNDRTENEAFIEIDKALLKQHVNVPAVIAHSDDYMCYLQEDLGDLSLYDIIKQNGFTPHVIDLCYKSIDQLVKMQVEGNTNIDFSKCHPVPEMTGESIMWDLNYFKYCFLKNTISEIDEPRLEIEFKQLVTEIENEKPRLFIHRDFQSRNILISNNTTWIIDFQSGRRGPAIYDIVSFLWQARAGFPHELKKELLTYYINSLKKSTSLSESDIRHQLPQIIIFRMLQVLGAYGFRGLVEKKQRFITYIPQALDILFKALNDSDIPYPYMTKIALDQIKRHNLENVFITTTNDNSILTINITSFAYKKGIPNDKSGNGGGFVFDCRAIHNPGRYEQYCQLTGDDLPVIEFLEYDGEIIRFLDHCKNLVDASIEKYIKRGFTNLFIAFGCTGGQHRSVYSATHMAHHIANKYGIHVVLNHRELDITKEFNK